MGAVGAIDASRLSVFCGAQAGPPGNGLAYLRNAVCRLLRGAARHCAALPRRLTVLDMNYLNGASLRIAMPNDSVAGPPEGARSSRLMAKAVRLNLDQMAQLEDLVFEATGDLRREARQIGARPNIEVSESLIMSLALDRFLAQGGWQEQKQAIVDYARTRPQRGGRGSSRP